ncbi:hypothetical protein UFOVP665_1 [uncultured Caudovirales phage]|jgi:hypothetical protein|uniref:Uncharacterized protein n=1 Tax=uncultured Caudovirales phage TaxID=2100421 RepID=A0A6J5N6Y6_9CAUD|nr:hypothetical protein UFOVP665_1 [uncultured Caudovirales phage]
MTRPIIAIHGTRSMYIGHRCRCEDCTTAVRKYQREYRAKLYADGYVFRRGELRRPSKNRIGRPNKQENEVTE